MVLFLLYMKAELENVQQITFRKDANLCITVKNPLSDYELREKVVVDPTQFIEQSEGSREPPHHFVLTWDGSKKAATLTILTKAEVKTALKKKKGAILPREHYTADDSGQFVPILGVECRGLEPTAFFPMGQEFSVTSSGGMVFDRETVDFSDRDWADYDADNDQPVSISDIEFKWDTA